MADQGSRVRRPIADWERETYAQGSEACRNYSNLTMRVRTLAQQVLLVAAAGLGAALIGKEEIDHFYKLMWIAGLLLAVFAVSLFFVDWHYLSAFTAIRNHLTTIEARHHFKELKKQCYDGPWTAHLDVRTRFRDHVANYLPFLLIGYVGVAAAIYGLHETPLWVLILVLVAVAVLVVFIWACCKASKQDKLFKRRLNIIRNLANKYPGSARSRLTNGESERLKETT